MSKKLGIAPIGAVPCKDQKTGKVSWLNLKNLKHPPPGPQLPDHLVERIKAYRKILGDADQTTFEDCLIEFRRDSHPEKEIAIWERIARTFEAEMRFRAESNTFATRIMLGEALVLISLGMEEKDVISSSPRLKALPHLNRIIAIYAMMP